MADAVAAVCLKRGCAKPLHAGHPWVFAEGVARIEGAEVHTGDEVRVVDDRGTCIGRGFFSPHSAIAVRIISRADAPITSALIISRIDEALRLRRDVLGLGQRTAGVPVAVGRSSGSPGDPEGRPTQGDQGLLAAIEEQISKIQSFAALYGMNALEETAELRKRRDELLKSMGVAESEFRGHDPDFANSPKLGHVPEIPGPIVGRSSGSPRNVGRPVGSRGDPEDRPTSDAYRLVNSEGDGLGGLIVDVYGEYAAVQIGTPGIARYQQTIVDTLANRLSLKGIFERTDPHTWKLEKMKAPASAVLFGREPEAPFPVREHGVEMLCDLRHGHSQKTGLFLDQRENRQRFASFASGRNVLDVFSYSGGFAVHAARAGAKSLTLLDSSTEALELAKSNLELNKIEDADLVNAEWTEGFKHLREAGRLFELIVLDPPKFARSKDNLAQALTAYRDLNAQAARLLAPGGLLFTCSCSGNVTEVEFERAVASGLRMSERRAVLLERRGAAPDHPVPPGFEQGRYLKCLVLQVL